MMGIFFLFTNYRTAPRRLFIIAMIPSQTVCNLAASHCYDGEKDDLPSAGPSAQVKEEIALSPLFIVSRVRLHVATSSPSARAGLPPTLIYSAPDPLLFCHADMFNKYCLPGTRSIGGVVVGPARKVMDDA